MDLRSLTFLLPLLALLPTPATAPAGARHEQVRGVTVSCQTWGWEWGSDGFAAELDRLKELGVNWVAIHPYAGVRGDGSLRWRSIDGDEPPVWIARPIREAHARGMAILVKPHLAYWGSPFRWRGEIAFGDAAAWERFFADYERWIVEVARAAQGADGFVVGTELDRTLEHEASWRRVVSAVRTVHSGHLTYAANWDQVERVPFWDALDAIGVQAYFPLSAEPEPTLAGLREGWRRSLAGLRALSERTGKPVVFTELGYDRAPHAAARPWVPAARGTPRDVQAERVRDRCFEAAFEVLGEERDWLRGAFLWKWFVGEAPGEDYLLDEPAMRERIRRSWSGR